MANHKSAQKRNRQTIKRTEANKVRKSIVRTAVKTLRKAIDEKDKESAGTLLVSVQSKFAKLARKNVVRSNVAARTVSRLAQKVANL